MQAGDTVFYVSGLTGRRTEVTILSIGPNEATIAQVADLTKQRTCRVSELRTQAQLDDRAAKDAASRAMWKPLEQELRRSDRYACMECGQRHNARTCPRCDSHERTEAR